MPRGVNDYDAGKLQGRNVANSNSVDIISPGLITDGLVLHFDAGNYVSYPAAGTTWFDLSGNNFTGTFTNGPTFNLENGGSIVFNGSNSYVQGPNSDILEFGTGNYTISYWIRYSVLTGFPTAIDLRASGFTAGWADYIQTSKYKIYYDGGDRYTSTATLATQTWYNIVVSRLESSNTVYINNSVDGTFTSSFNFTDNSLRIGNNEAGNGGVNGRIAMVLIYKNRGLTVTEVGQNFNATRARFGV